MGSKSKTSSTSSVGLRSFSDINQGASQLEQQGYGAQQQNFAMLQQLTAALGGASEADILRAGAYTPEAPSFAPIYRNETYLRGGPGGILRTGSRQVRDTAAEQRREQEWRAQNQVAPTSISPEIRAAMDARSSQQALASRLQGVLDMGGADVAAGQDFAQQIFAPQQVAMQQAFQDQLTQSQRLSARLGRSANDPILANKLAQEQTRQSAMLQAQQGAFAAEQSRVIPQLQLGYAAQLADLRGSLATQAFNNRSALMQMGNQLVSNERNYRLATANRTQVNTQSSNPGALGTIGAIAGIAGAGMSAYNSYAQGSAALAGKTTPSTGGGGGTSIFGFNFGGGGAAPAAAPSIGGGGLGAGTFLPPNPFQMTNSIP